MTRHNDKSGSQKELIDLVNEYEKISLMQLFSIVTKIKITALLSIVTLFFGYSLILYQFSAKMQINKIGISLKKPFNMVIEELKVGDLELDKKVDQRLDSAQFKEIVLKDIHLVSENDRTGLDDDEVRLRVRKINRAAIKDTKDIGKILAKKSDEVTIPLFNRINLMDSAHAQSNFRWYGHEDNFDFYEEQIDKYTIRRYYSDCWILEYKIDHQRRSIPNSFVWIKKGRSFLGYCV